MVDYIIGFLAFMAGISSAQLFMDWCDRQDDWGLGTKLLVYLAYGTTFAGIVYRIAYEVIDSLRDLWIVQWGVIVMLIVVVFLFSKAVFSAKRKRVKSRTQEKPRQRYRVPEYMSPWNEYGEGYQGTEIPAGDSESERYMQPQAQYPKDENLQELPPIENKKFR